MLWIGLPVLGLLVVFSFSRRSGPVRDLPPPARATPIEFLEALGSLYRNAGARIHGGAIAWERFRRIACGSAACAAARWARPSWPPSFAAAFRRPTQPGSRPGRLRRSRVGRNGRSARGAQADSNAAWHQEKLKARRGQNRRPAAKSENIQSKQQERAS
jgi:hypothetical protein